MKKEDMVIPPLVTVLLVGLCGAGKSALVNSMYSVLGRSGLIPFAQTSNGSSRPTTMFLEEHNVLRSTRSGFCIYDTRGLDMNRMIEGLVDVNGWMACGVRHYQPCLRPGDGEVLERDGSMPPMSSARFNTRQSRLYFGGGRRLGDLWLTQSRRLEAFRGHGGALSLPCHQNIQ